MAHSTKVTGVVLAGGQGRRMQQQDKGLLLFKGKPMVSYVINALTPITDQVIVSANRNIERYQTFGVPVMSDRTGDFNGPLAGLLAAMQYADAGILLVAPCDSPLIGSEHLQRLLSARAADDADIAVACTGEKIHPVFMAVKADLKNHLNTYLSNEQRKVMDWLSQHKATAVDFGAENPCFTNINTPEQLQILELLQN